jgi:hypothetical protein
MMCLNKRIVPGCGSVLPGCVAARRTFKQSKYLMPTLAKKKGKTDLPQNSPHVNANIVFKNYEKTRGTLPFDKHFLYGVICP